MLHEILANLADIIEQSPAELLFLGGDLNVNLNSKTPHAHVINNFLRTYKMTIGDTNKIMAPSNECDRRKYSFANEKLKRYTTIDFICLSLSSISCVTMYTTVESVSCHSDHLPVAILVTLPASCELTIYVNLGCLKPKLSKETDVKKLFNLRWDHCDIDLYYQTTCHIINCCIQFIMVLLNITIIL